MGLVVQLPAKAEVAKSQGDLRAAVAVREVRPPSVARRRLNRLLNGTDFGAFYSDAQCIPLGARPVLEAVVSLVALCGDGSEWRIHPFDQAHGGIARKLGVRMRVDGAEAEIRQHLATLQHWGLIKVGDGVLRLGDC